MTLVYIFGSGECDQLGMQIIDCSLTNVGLGDDAPSEIKRPKKIPLFDTGLAARRILKIACGGMHTVALSN